MTVCMLTVQYGLCVCGTSELILTKFGGCTSIFEHLLFFFFGSICCFMMKAVICNQSNRTCRLCGLKGMYQIPVTGG